jgi:tRNA-splicing ligase RtcB
VWDCLKPGEIERDAERIEANGSLPGVPEAVSEHARKRARDQLATLGGGNHFVELQRVESISEPAAAGAWGLFVGQLLIMLHSGSRAMGHQVGGDYMAIAEQVTRHLVPNKMLCYLPADSRQGQRYIGAMNAAANFAFANRELMTVLIRRNIRHHLGREQRCDLIYDVTHNMAKYEEHDGRMLWVHRKGATRAFGPARMAGTPFEATGQPVIIPGSMGTASYILVGLDGNDETLCSVNHGAGRRMSRSAATGVRRHGKVIRPGAISDEEFAAAMKGVELIAGDRAAAIEEAPQAYKDIDEVIRVVVAAGLAKVVARVRPLAVLKG